MHLLKCYDLITVRGEQIQIYAADEGFSACPVCGFLKANGLGAIATRAIPMAIESAQAPKLVGFATAAASRQWIEDEYQTTIKSRKEVLGF